MEEITKKEKVNLLALVLLLAFIFTVDLHKLEVNIGFILIPWIVYLPFLEGADFKDLKKVNFDMVFFFTGCMSIGTVATKLGLGAAIANLMTTVLAGNTSPFLIMFILFALVFALNFLMTPVAIVSLITVPILIMVTELGFNPVPFMYAVSASTEAVVLPYEYLAYLLVYSFGMMRMNDFIKFNAARSVVVFAGILLILVPYWMLIGLL